MRRYTHGYFSTMRTLWMNGWNPPVADVLVPGIVVEDTMSHMTEFAIVDFDPGDEDLRWRA